jgi:Ca-activated chloride channel family protein
MRLKNSISEWQAIDTLFILDVSKSMNVEDISGQFPRITFAKELIYTITEQYPENRYGLVIYSWEAMSVSPLTHDTEAFKNFLASVDYRNINEQWSNIWSAYSLAAKRLSYWEEDSSKLIILLSDWGDKETEPNYNDIKSSLWNLNISHIVLWVGTEKWGKIPKW